MPRSCPTVWTRCSTRTSTRRCSGSVEAPDPAHNQETRHAFPHPRPTRSIERWLIERVAFYLERPIHAVDPAVPLAEAGFDSLSAVGLCGDVEFEWGIEADPTLVFDYPTIDALAGFISAGLAAGQRAA